MRPRLRVAFVWLPLSASASLLLTTPSQAADSILAGRWTGVVQQSDGASYPAVMEFYPAGGGRSDYPTLDCSAKLSGTGTKGIYQFRETISTEGRAGGAGSCVDGTIRVTVSGDVMNWSWEGEWQGRPITASGTLTREGGSD